MRDPETPEEWQTAVDTAHGLLAVHSARAYGLIAGGPIVDVDRCAEIIRRGADQGITPSVDAIENVAAALSA